MNKDYLKSWIGKVVKVKIDRPLGSVHPKHEKIVYEKVNYGFIPGTKAGDGAEIDVYVLGVDHALNEFEGKIIAVVERKDDSEFKLVASEKTYTKSEIKDLLDFQEKYFDSEIIV